MKSKKINYVFVLILFFGFYLGCTDLDEKTFSAITPDNFYQTEAELVAAAVPVYSSLYTYFWNGSNLAEVSSDEIWVPTRGGDWGDNGRWRAIHEHKWTATLTDVEGGWLDAYTGVARANSALENMAASPQAETELVKTFIAEIRVLRALYYWWLCDLFGGVPIVTIATGDPDNPPTQNTRTEVYNFIVTEILEAIPQLQVSHGAGNYGRITRGGAQAILATVYLNAETYTGTAHWQDCIDQCNNIINSGLYDLLPEYKDNFLLANEGTGNPENIFVIAAKPQGGVSLTFVMRTLHYNQIPETPWNGFAVVTDFFNTFDTTDVRYEHMLVGPQLVLAGPNAGDPALDRNQNPLIFTPDIPSGDLAIAEENHGARILKWEIDPDRSGGDNGNDYAYFRYPHILLAKAEALNELNDPNQESIDLINQVRARAFDPDKPIALADYTGDKEKLRLRILDERGFEFLWEGYRRQDQIRIGTFLDAWSLKDASDGPHREVFPVPQSQLDANPNLTQTAGY